MNESKRQRPSAARDGLGHVPPPARAARFLRVVLLAVAAIATACGGGGGGGAVAVSAGTDLSSTATPVVPAAPVVVQAIATETPPVAPRVDLVAAGYMPLAQGSTWTYALRDANGVETGTSIRTLSLVPAGGSGTLRYANIEGNLAYDDTYRLAADGLYSRLDTTGWPAAALAVIGEIREYAFPNYAQGETRVIVRAGTWGQDTDGDGIDETFRLEYRQTYDGAATLALPWDAAATVAKLSASYRVTITSSRTGASTGLVSTAVETFAKDVGLVGSLEQVTDLAGAVIGARSMVVKSATVGGVTYAEPAGIDLVHDDLVFDPARNVFYASVPAAGARPNTIATIDAMTGATTYAAVAGIDPGILSLAPGGQFLYVGMKGSGEVVKLALPAMTESARVTLGGDAFYGTLFAEDLAVSPADPNLFAVSLRSANTSPKHRGVILVSGTTALPVSTQVHTGSNILAFNGDGTLLYGYNNETTEFGLRRITVAADGLRQAQVIGTNDVFGVGRMQFAGGRIYLRARAWTPELTPIGQFGDGSAGQCVQLAAGTRVACRSASYATAPELKVYDQASFALQGSVQLPSAIRSIVLAVPGPAGTIALSAQVTGGASRIYILRDNRL